MFETLIEACTAWQGPAAASPRQPAPLHERLYLSQTARALPGRASKGAVGDESPPAWSMLDDTAAAGGQPDSATSSIRLEVCRQLSASAACAILVCAGCKEKHACRLHHRRKMFLISSDVRILCHIPAYWCVPSCRLPNSYALGTVRSLCCVPAVDCD